MGIWAVPASPLVAGDFTGDGRLDLAVFSHQRFKLDNGVDIGSPGQRGWDFSSPRSVTLSGWTLWPLRRGISAGTGTSTSPWQAQMYNTNNPMGVEEVSVLLGQRRRTFQPRGPVRSGVEPNRYVVAGDFNSNTCN